MKNINDIVNLATGSIDDENKEGLFAEIEQNSESEEIYNKAKAAWAFLASTNNMPQYKIESSYKKLNARLNPQNRSINSKINYLLKYAAILFLFLCTVPLASYLKKQFTQETALKYTSVVAKYKQISEIILPDSSVVCLNSGSRLTYNNNYSLDNRDLQITGEAYFDIRKNKKIPLTVSCNDIKVKVLGTKFNVSAYPNDKNITVALESGSVELSHAKNRSLSYTLKPGEIAEYNTTTKDVIVKEVPIENYTGWKYGLLVFKDKPMDEVLKVIQRKFSVDFIVENPIVYEPAFNATFKDENLIEILDFIKYTCHIDYKIQKDNANNTIIRLY